MYIHGGQDGIARMTQRRRYPLPEIKNDQARAVNVEPAREVFALPHNIGERCRALNVRIEAGEALSLQYIADQVGIPLEIIKGRIDESIMGKSFRVTFIPTPPPKST
jgi:hypothetical protein